MNAAILAAAQVRKLSESVRREAEIAQRTQSVVELLRSRPGRVAQRALQLVDEMEGNRRVAEAQLVELEQLLQEGARTTASAPVGGSAAERAAALKAKERWTPTHSDWTRGRAALMEEYKRPENLHLVEYAELAGKSRQQIYKDIAHRRLLALNIGRIGQRVPSWQLDENVRRLTQAVLQAAADVDAWTLYQALTREMGSLRGRKPIEAVTRSNAEDVARKVCEELGVRPVVPA